jgi:hypothetical protein
VTSLMVGGLIERDSLERLTGEAAPPRTRRAAKSKAIEVVRDHPTEPMTPGNMFKLRVQSLEVSRCSCRHQAVLSMNLWPDDVALPTCGPRVVCTGGHIAGANVQLN